MEIECYFEPRSDYKTTYYSNINMKIIIRRLLIKIYYFIILTYSNLFL